jgi:Ca2+:H+ antiporter
MQVVLSIAALHKGLLTVVANSLVGSILSNLLLVMGGWPSVMTIVILE